MAKPLAGNPAAIWRVGFGAAHSGWNETAGECRLDFALPILGALGQEDFWSRFRPIATAHPADTFRLFERDHGWLAGAAVVPARFPLEELTWRLYREVFAVTHGRSLVRVWNMVPAINGTTDGLENYRSFCVGRARAFDETFGAEPQVHMPSASAVGTEDGQMALCFLAAPDRPRHVENPEQIPAWNYPDEHGPRPPSFARATTVRIADELWHFVSGTSAIKGHQTVGADDIDAQVSCTLDNLRLVSRELQLGEDFSAGRVQRRSYRVYLRRASDYARVAHRLRESIIRNTDTVVYLRADICRAALDVEIELTVQAAADAS